MNTHHLQYGELDTLQLSVPYVADPTELYAAVCQDKPYSMLLESAEIDSKRNVKSLMLVDAAVRIECRAQTVTLQALTHNGAHLLDSIRQSAALRVLPCEAESTERGNQPALTLTFRHPNDTGALLDEDARLRQASVFDALRVVKQSVALDNQPDDALFVGGLFAYDLVASTETLSSVDGTESCPDYLFYVAESLLVIDHQHRQARLQGTLFGGDNASAHYVDLSRRLQRIKEACLSPAPLPEAPVMTEHSVAVSVSDSAFCQQVEALKKTRNCRGCVSSGALAPLYPRMPVAAKCLSRAETRQSEPVYVFICAIANSAYLAPRQKARSNIPKRPIRLRFIPLRAHANAERLPKAILITT